MFQRIKYLIFQFSTTSRIFSYIFLISLFFTVVVVGMGASYFGLFSEEALRAEGIDNLFGGGLRDSFWWSMKHVFDPGALSENYGAPPPVLAFAIFNSVSGLVIISALIGIIVNSINAVTEKTKSGLYTVREINHLLILGWNKKSIPILKQFAKQGGKPRIVILTSIDIQYVHLELRREAKNLKGLKILPMKGSIAIPSDLDRIAVSKAAYILLLADGIGYKNSVSDIATIKTLMLLNTEKRQSYTTNIVAEIEKTENLPIADVASKLNHPVVSTSEFIGKTMVQCARYPGYAEIYKHLFSTEPYFAGGTVDFDDFYGDFVAFLGNIGHSAGTAFVPFRDMNQTILSGQNVNEGSKVDNLDDPTHIGLTNLRFGCIVLNHLHRGFRLLGV